MDEKKKKKCPRDNTLTLRISKKEVTMFNELKETTGQNKSAALRNAIEYYLNNHSKI